MLSALLLIINTVLPVFVVAGIGYLFARFALRRIVRETPRPIGVGQEARPGGSTDSVSEGIRRALHVLTFSFAGPAFVFTAVHSSDVAIASLGGPAVTALGMYVLLATVALVVSWAARWGSKERKAAVLALASKNCGNYGLPLILFAFGEEGLLIGTVFMVTHLLVHLTLGLSIASWSGEHPVLRRIANVLRFPYIYAIGLALLVQALGVSVPAAIDRPLALVGQMWIPLMLLLLGVELAGIRPAHIWRPALLLSAVKLLVPPLLAVGLTSVLGVGGLARAVLIIQASTPTAVNGLLVARQFDVRPDLVSSTLLLTTLGSIVTLSVLLAFLAS